jgi:hypothetical protein
VRRSTKKLGDYQLSGRGNLQDGKATSRKREKQSKGGLSDFDDKFQCRVACISDFQHKVKGQQAVGCT